METRQRWKSNNELKWKVDYLRRSQRSGSDHGSGDSATIWNVISSFFQTRHRWIILVPCWNHPNIPDCRDCCHYCRRTLCLLHIERVSISKMLIPATCRMSHMKHLSVKLSFPPNSVCHSLLSFRTISFRTNKTGILIQPTERELGSNFETVNNLY